MATITIFTPTYNNADNIVKLYDSLSRQNCKGFQWLIVDDGSVDDTKEVVSGFQRGSDFEIRYYYQENQGKYMAHYFAIQKCTTELFCCIDADFALHENIVEVMLKEWNDYRKKASIIGVGFPMLCRYYNDPSKSIGGTFPDKVPEIGRLHELTSIYGYHGETVYVFCTTVIKELSVPKISGEKFWNESGFYFPLNQKYKVHWCNVPVGESIYQPDGLSSKRLRNEVESPRLTLLAYKRGAIYHPLFLHRVANCCLYLSWKKLMNVKDEFAEDIPWYIRLIAYCFEPIYCRSFRSMISEYLRERMQETDK